MRKQEKNREILDVNSTKIKTDLIKKRYAMSRTSKSTPKTTEKDRLVFSENLKRYLKDHGVSQVALANALNRSPSSVNNWVKAVSIPPYSEVVRIADYFSIQPEDLYSSPVSYSVRQSVRVPVVRDLTLIPVEPEKNPKTVLEVFKGYTFKTVVDFVEIPFIEAKKNRYFGYELTDNNLAPRFLRGDILLIRLQPEICDTDAWYLVQEPGGTGIRKYCKQEKGFILSDVFPYVVMGDPRRLESHMKYYPGVQEDYEDLKIFGVAEKAVCKI